MASRFNLSEWALTHRSLVLYIMLICAVVGVWSYTRLGQSEDPPFTFKAMVVQTYWPGASAKEVSEQVTDRIEQKLMETGEYEFIRSYSRPGQSQVIFFARDAMRSSRIPSLWYQVRKKIGDIRSTLPAGVVGPFFNDEFGDTFGNIYALTGNGYDDAILKEYAKRLQLQLQRMPDVGKVELIGLQQQKVWIDIDNARLATLGVPLTAIAQALQAQNEVAPNGFFDTPGERIQIRVDGAFGSVEEIGAFPIQAGDRSFRLSDLAQVRRGYAEPEDPKMRFMGEDAIGIAVAMREGGDILRLGRSLESEFARLQNTLPVGMQLRKVADQPAAVTDSVNEFVKVLAEAVIVVLLVSFFSLGLRTGLVVAVSIPLVLAMTFASMHYFDIGLHKISLGALVLALGLLVDDAIIAVEMMAIKMEQGHSRLAAAGYAWSHTAFPMLTGTLVTAAGFLPIATAASSTGEYTRSLFQVVTIALLVSWVAAVLFIPYLGDKMLPDLSQRTPAPGSVAARWHRFRWRLAQRWPRLAILLAPGDPHAEVDPYQRPFYRRLRRVLEICLRQRWWVIGATAAAFVLSMALFRFVPQQFFPDSTRPELIVDMQLEEGASLAATRRQALRLEAMLKGRVGIRHHVAYIGTGSPRFYLPLDQQLPAANFAQFVVLTQGAAVREQVREWLLREVAPRFPGLQMRVTRLESGPPVGYPVQFRVSGEHIEQVRALAQQVAAKISENQHLVNVNLDWDAPNKVVRLAVDQERARALGVSSGDLSRFLAGVLSGMPVGHYREGTERIEILMRGGRDDRQRLNQLSSLSVSTADGRALPLAQIARVESVFEPGIIWHRNRLPTITVRADIRDGMTPPSVIAQIEPTLAGIRAALPAGYLLETGGTVEDSRRGQRSVNAGMPLFVLVVTTLLMLQLRSFSKVALVLLTAPLGMIGATLFLLLFQVPFGFVAMLGTIALAGMIMRNSVILVDQIQQDIDAGHDRWHAIIDATVRRFRPIVLTALAAVLAMIPLSRSIFYGPMAVAIMGGLIVATLLTLLFLPALYAAWFNVRPDEASPRPPIPAHAS